MCENLYALDAIFVPAHKQYCFKSYYFKLNSGKKFFSVRYQKIVFLYKIIDYINRKIIMQYCVFSR